LGGDHGALFELDHGDGVGGGFLVSGGGVVDGGIGIDLAATAEGIGGLGFAAALRADVPGREELGITMGADFAHEGIALLLQSPVTGNFH
jgi:hypothetical protein